MEFKGTKGKWIANEEGSIFSEVVKQRVDSHKDYAYLDETGEIAQCWQDFYDDKIIPEQEMKANALLISKAPEMLNMLKEVIEFLHKVQAPATSSIMLGNEINKLIKEATQLEDE